MFGHESKPTKNYVFGCRPPESPDERKLLDRQIWLAHRYRNLLVSVERMRRSTVNTALNARFPDIAAADAAVKAAKAVLTATRDKITTRNAKNRSRSILPEDRKAVAAANKAFEAAGKHHRALRNAGFADPEMKAILAPIEARFRARNKHAQHAVTKVGIYWGNYLTINRTIPHKGPPPRYQSWDRSGTHALQNQGGLSIAKAMSCKDFQLRLETKSGAKRALAWFRVGSIPGSKKPIWVKIPFFFHRQLPAHAKIKWAYFIRRRIANRFQHELCLALASDSWGFSDRGDAAGVVGIDVGWRVVPHGLRVAYWATNIAAEPKFAAEHPHILPCIRFGDDGKSGEIFIPSARLDMWQKVDDLKSIRDNKFNDIKEAFADAIAKLVAPPWFIQRTTNLWAWRKIDRLASLLAYWERNRFHGDEAAFALLQRWRDGVKPPNYEGGDLHLYKWQCYQSQNIVRWRNDVFRNFAVAIRRRYAKICIEQVNWTKVQKKQLPEEDTKDVKKARYNARVAAVGHMMDYLLESGAEKKSAYLTTQICHKCQKRCKFDAAKNLWHTCEHCGASWDQDYNAAMRLLAMGLADDKPA